MSHFLVRLAKSGPSISNPPDVDTGERGYLPSHHGSTSKLHSLPTACVTIPKLSSKLRKLCLSVRTYDLSWRMLSNAPRSTQPRAGNMTEDLANTSRCSAARRLYDGSNCNAGGPGTYGSLRSCTSNRKLMEQ